MQPRSISKRLMFSTVKIETALGLGASSSRSIYAGKVDASFVDIMQPDDRLVNPKELSGYGTI